MLSGAIGVVTVVNAFDHFSDHHGITLSQLIGAIARMVIGAMVTVNIVAGVVAVAEGEGEEVKAVNGEVRDTD